jgi:uncharacterized protein (TIGR03083 family)
MPDSMDPRRTWLEAIESFADLANGLTEAQWQSPSPCPGWTVGDLVAHTIDIEERLSGAVIPDHEPDWARLPHVTESGRRMEPGVDRRRGRDRSAVLDELGAVIVTRSAQMAGLDLDATIASPFGREIPMTVMMRMRVFDLWVHEQDIRAAIGEPGNLASSAARATLSMIVDSLPRVWAKVAAAPVGGVLLLEITGGALPGTIHVVVDEEGRGSVHDIAPTDPLVTLRGTWPALLAAATGRPSDQTLDVTGDTVLASAVLAHLNMAP